MLTTKENASLINLRRDIHRCPELSSHENLTAKRLLEELEQLNPDGLFDQLGVTGTGEKSTGIAACFGEKKRENKTFSKIILFRCELDALPIEETINLAYKSIHQGVSHKCGHDGHMAILMAVATYFSKYRPQGFQVICLFQPAEETGYGAQQVINDPRFSQLNPDMVFSLHNVPGLALGAAFIRTGTLCCASRGLTISYRGKSAHAAQPETGISPVPAIYKTIEVLENINKYLEVESTLSFATIVGIKLGDKAFGTAPSHSELYVTLRSDSNGVMDKYIQFITQEVKQLSEQFGLELELNFQDVFAATINTPNAVSLVKAALIEEPVVELDTPFRWSEDFGLFTAKYCGAMFGLGAGLDTPALHDSKYDFPDELIEIGSRYFIKIAKEVMSTNS